MNVEVFQHKARRKKINLSCTLEQMKQLAKGPNSVKKCIEPWPGPAACPVNFYQAYGLFIWSMAISIQRRAGGYKGVTIVHSKKSEPSQPQLVGWYERRPLHDPNMVFSYWSKKKATMFGGKTIILSWYTGCCSQPLLSEHRCVWPLKVLLSCYWAFSGFVARLL